MSTKHTPGPWHAEAESLDGEITRSVVRDGYGKVICEVELHDEEVHNGRLIASAPELLEALHLLTDGWKYPTEVCQIARAAIAKAEGQS